MGCSASQRADLRFSDRLSPVCSWPRSARAGPWPPTRRRFSSARSFSPSYRCRDSRSGFRRAFSASCARGGASSRPGRGCGWTASFQRSGTARSSRAWPRFASSPSDLCSLESAPSSCLGFPRPCSPCPAPTPLLAAGAFAAGFGLILFNTLFETTVQQHVPAAALSRVSSIDWMLSLGLYPIGLALAGWVAEVIGVGATLAVAAAWALLSTPLVLAVPSVRNLRRRDGPPEADPATIQPL